MRDASSTTLIGAKGVLRTGAPSTISSVALSQAISEISPTFTCRDRCVVSTSRQPSTTILVSERMILPSQSVDPAALDRTNAIRVPSGEILNAITFSPLISPKSILFGVVLFSSAENLQIHCRPPSLPISHISPYRENCGRRSSVTPLSKTVGFVVVLVFPVLLCSSVTIGARSSVVPPFAVTATSLLVSDTAIVSAEYDP